MGEFDAAEARRHIEWLEKMGYIRTAANYEAAAARVAALEAELAACRGREAGLREACKAAKAFIENLRVPQTVEDAAIQVVLQGMPTMRAIDAALAPGGEG